MQNLDEFKNYVLNISDNDDLNLIIHDEFCLEHFVKNGYAYSNKQLTVIIAEICFQEKIPFFFEKKSYQGYMFNFTETDVLITHANSYDGALSEFEWNNIKTFLIMTLV